MTPTHADIQLRAYYTWLAAGRPADKADHCWYQAERKQWLYWQRLYRAKCIDARARDVA